MGTFSFVSFIITLSIILTNEFDGIDAGRPKDGKKPLPPTVDWRARGAVTPIKDQGNCGSDYAYAPVAVCEALYFFKTRKLISLSAQQMIDCTSNSEYFNLGCDGGWPESVLDYMVKKPKHGLEPDSVYGRDATKRTTTTTTTKRPYHHRKTTAKRSYKHATTTSPPPPQPPQNPGVCKYDPKHVVLNISRWNYVSCDWDPKCPHNDEKEMARAVDIAPIVVYFYSSCDSFRNYDGGFYQDEKCCSNKTSMDTDHGMTIVGYGTDEHKGPYWILKNSWGTKWGEKGYMRIKRGVNLCGIATTAIAVHA